MQPILSHHFSLTSCWASPQPQRVWRNMFFHTCIQSQTCRFSHTGGCQILHDVFLQILNRHGISFLLSEELSSSLPDSFDGFCPSPSVFAFELDAVEDDRPFSSLTSATVSRGNVSWLRLHEARALKTVSHFPLNLGFVSFLTLGDCSSSHNFVMDSEVSSSHHLTNMKFYSCPQSWITRLSIVSNSYKVVQSQNSLKLNRVL